MEIFLSSRKHCFNAENQNRIRSSGSARKLCLIKFNFKELLSRWTWWIDGKIWSWNDIRVVSSFKQQSKWSQSCCCTIFDFPEKENQIENLISSIATSSNCGTVYDLIWKNQEREHISLTHTFLQHSHVWPHLIEKAQSILEEEKPRQKGRMWKRITRNGWNSGAKAKAKINLNGKATLLRKQTQRESGEEKQFFMADLGSFCDCLGNGHEEEKWMAQQSSLLGSVFVSGKLSYFYSWFSAVCRTVQPRE